MIGKGITLAFLISTGLLAFAGCATFSANAEEPEPPDREWHNTQRDDAFEVTVHERYSFRGRSETYVLADDMRQGLVRFVGWGLNDRISSIRVGYRVGVVVFHHRDFHGRAQIVYNTTSNLDSVFNDEVSSLIVFDRDFGEPMGIWLGQGAVNENDFYNGLFPEQSRFYPLPEELNEDELQVKFLEDFNDQAEWAFVAGRGDRGMAIIEAILYEHDKYRGNSIVLPPSYRDGRALFFLGEFSFDRKASSLIVRGRQPYRRPYR